MKRSTIIRPAITRRAFFVLAALLAALAQGCWQPAATAPRSALEQARAAAAANNDAENIGAWLLAELLAPGGERKRAEEARAALAKLSATGLNVSLARAVDADVRGRFDDAAKAYAATLNELRDSPRADAPLLAWFAASRLAVLRAAVQDLFEKVAPIVNAAIDDPRHLGWRARGELVEWWSRQAHQHDDGPRGKALLELTAAKHGCLREALIAGPFGRGGLGDRRVHFEPEQPKPWPARFATGPAHGNDHAEIHPTERYGCSLFVSKRLGRGVFYVQSFFELPEALDVIVVVQGAFGLRIDDVEVQSRNRAELGARLRSGVQLRLGPGRHRLVARLGVPKTSIRLLSPEGLPLGLKGSTDQARPYVLTPPQRLTDPNVLVPFLRALAVPEAEKDAVASQSTDHPLARYVASYLAHSDTHDDVASVLIQPLVEDLASATPVALAQQAVFVDRDPVFTTRVARDLARDLRRRAAQGDDQLWGPQLWLALDGADKRKPAELVRQMEALDKRFPQVPTIIKRLARIYGRLGWLVEHNRALADAARRFPQDIELLKSLLSNYELRGKRAEADALAARILAIDPTEEIALVRMLKRRDYVAAVAELKRIGKLRQDRRVIAIRVADLLMRAGRSDESLAKLRLAVEKDRFDASARLALADARYAAGHQDALDKALVEAIRTGASSRKLRTAIELVEGATDLEPYRRDGLAVIREAEAKGARLPGTAARVLDYAALWIARDGSARMLEHEIIRIQSSAGITQHTEQDLPRGLVLRMRTIKRDGRVLEPELVEGKPKVTMPHLEVGDYVETESIWIIPKDGRNGRRLRWYFREPNISYHLSEFVVISPSDGKLAIETTGSVPEPSVKSSAGLTKRRWKVTEALALPEERAGPPIAEFLPSVWVDWGGKTLHDYLRTLSDLHSVQVPLDPRMRRIAETIVAGKLVNKEKSSAAGRAHSADERARRIYRWVLDTIQPGSERSPPRIITSKSGDRTEAFLYLCGLVGVDAKLGVVRSRLTPPPGGSLSAATSFSIPAVRVKTEGGSRWVLIQERLAPYGWLPSALRGQPAYVLDRDQPSTAPNPPPLERVTTTSAGADDGVVQSGSLELSADGSGVLKLKSRYRGTYAVSMRTNFSRISSAGSSAAVDQKRREMAERIIVGRYLPGARVTKLTIENLENLDEPLRLSMVVNAPNIAHVTAGALVLPVPFLGSLAGLVALPQRESPLYIRNASHAEVTLDVKLPAGAKLAGELEQLRSDSPQLLVDVADKMVGKTVHIEREVNLPAGRIQPEQYPSFRKTVQKADAALNRKLRIILGD